MRRLMLRVTLMIQHLIQAQQIWMLHSRTLNNKIYCIHERALGAVYFDYKSSFSYFLDKDDSFAIQQKMFKV